ncbi:(S)-2-hydroxy-acid oxidase [Treponema primitia ZAS-2]|uniref:(S)-2-hydroxy-acid oxidase n=1 Tax=Treponema primitia (strain ATCC BAA-887 / DSM 12427 / ZAS-2) TaxID=545694 RepID=F5YLQ3_TREPZ|nr:alpha-hydroxy acid oxidase [Treponema primitia]AEF85419.1 (S)-2-hydroxy-acid oxidase [Treponema primitia ZAS-2]
MGEGDKVQTSVETLRDYFDSLLVELRVIDSVEASTGMTLYGHSFATPVMEAALSGLDKVRPNGTVEAAKGVAAAGAVMWTGIGSEEELESIIAAGAKTIKIIKPYADKDLIFKKIEHAEKAGAIAVGMDIDFVFGGKSKKGFAMEYPVSPKTLDDVKSFVKATKLPFILKGILSERDAEKALEAGAGGIVVSHHGGIVDCAVPPLQILPRITKLIKRRIPIFVDCGITRGTDVFKALALGATAVSVGKVIMPALKNDGAPGVQKVFEEITAGLNWVMSLTGSRDLEHIDPAVLWNKLTQ